MAILQSTTVTGSLIVSGSTDNLVQVIGSGSTLFSVNGASGQLFGIADDLTDSLFSVNTIAGLPVIEAFADNTVKIGTFGNEELIVSESQVSIVSASLSGPAIFTDGNVGIGTTSPGNTLHVFKNATTGPITSTTVANAGLRIQDSGANMYIDGNSIVTDSSGYLTTTGANSFVIGTNNIARIHVDAGGNVGIGTTSPGKILDLESADALAIRFYSGGVFKAGLESATTAGQMIATSNVGDFTIRSQANLLFSTGGNTERMRIDSSGNVLVGKTTTGLASVGHQLNNDGGAFHTKSGNTVMFLNRTTSDGTIVDLRKDNVTVGSIASVATGKIGFYGSGGTGAVIDSSGNVGIGTDSPDVKLQVEDSAVGTNIDVLQLTNTDDSTGAGAGIEFFSANAEFAYIRGSRPADTTYGHLTLGIRGTGDVINIRDEGNVGIGTTSPSEKLEVEGNISGSGTLKVQGDAIIARGSTSGKQYYHDLYIGGTGLASTDSAIYIGNQGNGTGYGWELYYSGSGSGNENKLVFISENLGSPNNVMTMLQDGNVGIGTTSPNNQLHIEFANTDTAFSGGSNGAWGSEGIRIENTSSTANTMAMLQFRNSDADIHIAGIRQGTDDSDLGFFFEGTEKIRFTNNGNVGIGTDSPVANAKVTNMGNMTFGIPGNGSNTSGRFISIEGNTDGSGEGSGRIFFTEHNSTTGAMSKYGMSIGYRGGGTSIVGADGNTWTGLGSIGNGEWGMWGHDNSAAGALIMYGPRSGDSVTVAGDLFVNDYARIDALRVGTTSTDPGDGNLYVEGSSQHGGTVGYTSFNSGFGGNGWRIDSSANAEFENLTVRGTFSVYELLAQQIRATNGSLLVATSGKVDNVNGSTLNFDTGSTYGHGFLVNDILLSQRLDPSGGELKRSFIQVASTSNSGSLTFSLLDGGTPEAGFEYVRIGNTSNTDRQGHIYLTADDNNAPYIGVRDGVDAYTDFTSGTGSVEKVRVGRLDGVTSTTFGSLNGYGLWASGSVYLEGGISATFGDIGGFGISQTTISSSNDNLILRDNGDITGSNVLFDGGKIAGFSISGNSLHLDEGAVEVGLGTADQLSWSSNVVGLQVGEDANNRIFLGEINGLYEFRVLNGANPTVILGSRDNRISSWSLATTEIQGGTVSGGGDGSYTTSGMRLGADGYISAPKFYLSSSGDANFKGTLTAPDGNIGGFTISGDALAGSNFYISGSATGNEFFISSSNFNVKANGDVTGSSVLFDGGKIGGFDITSDKLSIVSGDFEILQGSLFSNNIGYRVVENAGGSRQINMRYDTADDSLEFLIYKDSSNYFNVGNAYADQYDGWGLNLRIAGEDILKVESETVTLSGFTASLDAFAGSNFYLSGSATGNEFFISSSNFNVKANGDVTGSSVLFTGGRIGDEYQNITFDPNGNISLKNVELKISDTTGLRTDIYDGANSKRVVLDDDTIYYTTFEDDTLISILAGDGSVKSTITVADKYTEGTISSADIVVGDILDTDKPVSFTNVGGGHSVLPYSFLSKTFLMYSNRYQPRTIRVYSPFGDATVSASFSTSNDGNFSGGVAASIVNQNVATDINASDIVSGTWPVSDTTSYFKIESDLPILAFNDGPTGDFTSLYPLSKEILHADQGEVINLNPSTSATLTGDGYYTANTPFQVQRIGDGGGGDSDQGMPVQALGDTYIIPHSVGGYEILSIEPNIVKVYTLTTGTKTLDNTVDHSAASKTNPLNTLVGSDEDGGSGIHTGAMLFEGTAPFALRTQDPGDDEYHVIGYRRTQREVYDNSTTIKGDRIRTGKIQSNNWNDSTAGSLIDLNLGTAHLGGSGSNASLYFDGTDLFLTGSINATSGNFTGTISAGDGDIGGFTISGDALAGSNFYLSGSATSNDFFISASNFNVKANGDVTGSSVLFDGGKVASFNFDADRLSNTDGTFYFGNNLSSLSDNSDADHIFMGNWSDGSNPIFRISGDGGSTQNLLQYYPASGTNQFLLRAGGDDVLTVSSTGVATIAGFTFTSNALSGTNFYLSGSATGNEFFISSSNFNVKANGDVTGSSVLLDGGDIGGWTIGASSLTAGDATLADTGNLTLGTSNDVVRLSADDSTYRLWTGHATAGSAPFSVTKAGALTASNATITGDITANTGTIGGFTISGDALAGSNFYLSGSATGNEFFISSSNFNVKANGDVTGSSVLFDGGEIAGWEIQPGYIRKSFDAASRISLASVRTDGYDPIGLSLYRDDGDLDSNTDSVKIMRFGQIADKGTYNVWGDNAYGLQIWKGSTTLGGEILRFDSASALIGGFEIDTDEISDVNNNLRLKASGQITASAAFIGGTSKIAGFSISDTQISDSGGSSLILKFSGQITASAAQITGDITATNITATTAGNIAGWSIGANTLSSGNVNLSNASNQKGLFISATSGPNRLQVGEFGDPITPTSSPLTMATDAVTASTPLFATFGPPSIGFDGTTSAANTATLNYNINTTIDNGDTINISQPVAFQYLLSDGSIIGTTTFATVTAELLYGSTVLATKSIQRSSIYPSSTVLDLQHNWTGSNLSSGDLDFKISYSSQYNRNLDPGNLTEVYLSGLSGTKDTPLVNITNKQALFYQGPDNKFEWTTDGLEFRGGEVTLGSLNSQGITMLESGSIALDAGNISIFNGGIDIGGANGHVFISENDFVDPEGYKLFMDSTSDEMILMNRANIGTISMIVDGVGGQPEFAIRRTTSNTEVFRIDNSGNVGIGTTSPSAKLQVEGSGSTIFDVQGSLGQLFSVTDDLTGTLFSVNDISGIPILSVDSDDTVTMGTFGADTLVVTGSNVGIGTVNPSQKLHIYDATSDAPLRVESGDAYTGIQFTDPSSTGNLFYRGDLDHAYFSGGTSFGVGVQTPSYAFEIELDQKINNGSLGVDVNPNTTDGRIDAANDIVAFSSDRRLKENIEYIKDPIGKIKTLSGFTYNWNELAEKVAKFDRNNRYVGVFAQDVQAVLPEAIKPAPFDNDGNNNSISGENYLTVQYEKLIPLLVEGMKEQQKEIDELKKIIEEMRKKDA